MSLVETLRMEQPVLMNGVRLRAAYLSCRVYVAAAVLSVLLSIVVGELWRTRLHIPLTYSHDAVLAHVLVKSTLQHGWYLRNPNLGAPGAMELYDFPMADALHFLMIKALGLFSGNCVVVLNLYYLLTFPLCALTSLFVFRKSGIDELPALVGSQLFAFLPYHLFRGVTHVFLSAYYLVPLSMLMALWVYFNRYAPAGTDDATPGDDAVGNCLAGSGAGGVESTRTRWVGSAILCILQASAGVYYAFFACYLLLVAGLAAALREGRVRPLFPALAFIAITAAGIGANVWPSLMYRWEQGKNPAVGLRIVMEAELYALRVAEMVLPVPDHRIAPLARRRAAYDNSLLNRGESQTAVLGAAGSLGFFVLIGQLLYRRNRPGRPTILDGLCTLNIFAVMLGTSSAFGSIFSLVVTPKIRAYNRISIYIAFLAIFAAVLLLQRLATYCADRRRPKWQFGLLACLILMIGILDQTPHGAAADYTEIAGQWKQDAEFVHRIETSVPAGAAIYQLPYMWFPEHPAIHHMTDYQHLRGYLHSDDLRWSYGAIRGRQQDQWMKQVAGQPIGDQIQAMAAAGFAGIYIDRRAYEDHAAGIEKDLRRLLGAPPLVSTDRQMSFFKFTDRVR